MNIIFRFMGRLRNFVFANIQDSWKKYRNYIKIDSSVIIAPEATIKLFNPPKNSKICLEIDKDSHIFSNFNLLRPQAKISIGKRCQLGSVNFVCAQEIEVGDDVMMAWGINILDSDNHSVDWRERKHDVKRSYEDYLKTRGFDLARSHDWSKVKTKKVTIKNKCWIGLNVIILKGVTIGEGAVIGAGSVVTSDIKPWHLAAGNPAKEIRKIL